MGTSLNADIIIATLNHSTLPTVLVEGKDDMKVFRWIEKQLGISALACGGRSTVLEVFERRGEIKGLKVVFFADRDLWYFSGIPTEYVDVLFTHGYSIENDLCFDGWERLEELLDTTHEVPLRNQLLAEVVQWYAFEVELASKGGVHSFPDTLLSDKVMDQRQVRFEQQFLNDRGYTLPPSYITQQVEAHCYSGLRGKYLFDIYFRVLQSRRTGGNDVTYSHQHLWDLCYRAGIKASNTNSRIMQIKEAIRAAFN